MLCGLNKIFTTKGTKILHEEHKRQYSTLWLFFTLRLSGLNKTGSLIKQICTDVYSFVMICGVTVQIKYLPQRARRFFTKATRDNIQLCAPLLLCDLAVQKNRLTDCIDLHGFSPVFLCDLAPSRFKT